MQTLLLRLVRETDGQNLAEYGIALAVVAVGAAASAMSIAHDTTSVWSRALQALVIAMAGN
jgi:Flp pilus assembly pilin Flp